MAGAITAVVCRGDPKADEQPLVVMANKMKIPMQVSCTKREPLHLFYKKCQVVFIYGSNNNKNGINDIISNINNDNNNK